MRAESQSYQNVSARFASATRDSGVVAVVHSDENRHSVCGADRGPPHPVVGPVAHEERLYLALRGASLREPDAEALQDCVPVLDLSFLGEPEASMVFA